MLCMITPSVYLYDMKYSDVVTMFVYQSVCFAQVFFLFSGKTEFTTLMHSVIEY